MHFLHLSTAGAIEMMRAAKAAGLPVTAEVTPHHLALCDACVAAYDPLFKVNPPLRSVEDVNAVRRGLADGTIDAVATDHAPHAPERKEEPFEDAPAGMIGLETALAVAFDACCASGTPGTALPQGDGWVPTGSTPSVSLRDLLGLFSWQPARIAGLDADARGLRADLGGQGGPIRVGAAANIMVFDPSASWVVDPFDQASRSRNTPYGGRRLTGKVRHSVSAGQAVVIDGEAQR
jgi:dihydroorotase